MPTAVVAESHKSLTSIDCEFKRSTVTRSQNVTTNVINKTSWTRHVTHINHSRGSGEINRKVIYRNQRRITASPLRTERAKSHAMRERERASRIIPADVLWVIGRGSLWLGAEEREGDSVARKLLIPLAWAEREKKR